MPKELIQSEKKQEIIAFIKEHPTIDIPQLKEKYGIKDGRILNGFINTVLGRTFSKKGTIKKESDKTEQKVIPKTETKEPPNPGGDEMALEKKDIEAIVEGVATTIEKLRQAEKVAESTQEEKKAIQDTIKAIPELKEKIAMIPSDLCTTFPGLCKEVKDVKTQLTTLAEDLKKRPEPPKPEPPKKEKILDTEHDTLEELLSCPECVIGHIKKVGLDNAAKEICKDDEICKATLAELTKKGYKIEEPREGTDASGESKEGKNKEKPEEGTEKKGHFILGRTT